VIELGRARGRFTSAAALLPRSIVDALRREAPLRFGVASVLVRGRAR
jgi:hypothetical protein